MYTVWSNGADCLRMLEKTLCFVQERAQRWDDIVWKQRANVKDTAIDSEEGERDAKDTDDTCHNEWDDDSKQVIVGHWILGHCGRRGLSDM
jgi:hypothetical protein